MNGGSIHDCRELVNLNRIREHNQITFRNELRFFSSSGFVTMTSISPADEEAGIRKMLRDLVDRRAGEKDGSFFDIMEGSNSQGVLRSIQINNPSLHRRQLLETWGLRHG